MAITVKEPAKWSVEMGATADINEIPETADADSGLASVSALFPQLTALPLSSGGKAPKREDFNGLFTLIGQWVRYYMYGGVPSWSKAAAYTAGSLCSYNGSTWTALRASTNVTPAEGSYWHALSNYYTSATLVGDLLNKVYPVGSIYMSVVNVSPASFLGGTWQAIEQGRMLMSAGSSWKVLTTGGNAYHTLTVAELPAHAHGASETAAGQHAHTASIAAAGDHTHAGTADAAGQHAHSATSATAGEHAHTGTADTAGAHTHGASTGSAGAHSHSGSTDNAGNHYHTGQTSAAGAHAHNMNIFWFKNPGEGGACDSGSGQMAIHNFNTSTDGNHSHGFSTSWAGEHAHSLSIASAGAHTHSVAIAAAGAHTHAITIGKTGSGAAFSILPPYIAVYMWRRTA